MNLLDKPSGKVSKPSWELFAFMVATALSVSSCFSLSPNMGSETSSTLGRTNEIQDTPIFLALVRVEAELKHKLKPDSTPQTLDSIKKYIRVRFNEMGISYTSCDITFNEDGGNSATLLIYCDGETLVLPVTPGQIIENSITNNERLDYLKGLKKRFECIFGYESIEEGLLQAVLEDEKELLKHHGITPIPIPDKERKGYFWIIFK